MLYEYRQEAIYAKKELLCGLVVKGAITRPQADAILSALRLRARFQQELLPEETFRNHMLIAVLNELIDGFVITQMQADTVKALFAAADAAQGRSPWAVPRMRP